MEADYIISPVTGRAIKVGGPTYEKLKNEYNLSNVQVFRKKSPQKAQPSEPVSEARFQEMVQLPVYQPNLKKSIEQAKQPYLKKRAQAYKDVPQGSHTRGWALDSPKRGKERNQLKKACGNKCFLLPDTNGFPICPKCETEGECSCKIDCRGLKAAKARAGQYGYQEELYGPIDKLYNQKCD